MPNRRMRAGRQTERGRPCVSAAMHTPPHSVRGLEQPLVELLLSQPEIVAWLEPDDCRDEREERPGVDAGER